MSSVNENNINNENEQIVEILQTIIGSYSKKGSSISDEVWVEEELKKHVPHLSQEEIVNIRDELILAVDVQNENIKSLDTALEKGTSKEKWFHEKIQEATVGMEVSRVGQYLQEIDSVIATANQQMHQTITKLDGSINMNPNLDGFIFEQHHANTFNREAALRGSKLRAEVLNPKTGENYTKNSVDLVVKDEWGRIVKKYQAKFCADSDATNNAFDHGNYPFQGKLVSEGQTGSVPNSKETIGVGKITSKQLNKGKGKELQTLAQEGKSMDVDWNYYKLKDLTSHMTKNVAVAGFQAATVAVGYDLVYKKMSNQEIKTDEVVELALRTGADAGIKSATAVALKAASEKGLISVIPKGTPAGVIATIASISIENVKVLGKVADGELTLTQGFEKMERVTVSAVGGLITGGIGAGKGAVIGAIALSWIPVVGTAAGAFLGSIVSGTVAYMAGSTIGEKVCTVAQKVRNTAVSLIKSGARAVGKAYNSAKNFLKSFF